jgi:peptide/nickel transport system substrate-binding protein
MKKTIIWVLVVLLTISMITVFSSTGCKKEIAPATETTVSETTAAKLTVPETTAAPETSAGEAGPKVGGTYTFAIEMEPTILDDHLLDGMTPQMVTDMFNDFLWVYNDNFGEFIPHVAESWEWLSNISLKINIRKGVKFHNGREVTANDVKYSIERVLDPNTGSPKAVFFEKINKITVESDSVLTIDLKEPYYGLMDRLTFLAIVPKEVVEAQGDLKTKPVGCGPFVFESWEPGVQFTAKKFADYYMKGEPYVDKVVIKFMPEYNTAKNALLAGEIDGISWPDIADFDSLKSNQDLEIYYLNLFAPEYISFNTSVKPLDNPKVRQAIALAINRDSYNDAFNKGGADLAWTPIPANSPYYNKNWEYKRDIEKAKSLLAEAGYADGFKIRILVPKTPEEVLGEILSAELKDIGITAEISVMEVAQFLDALLSKEDFDITILGDVISPDPDFFASKYFLPDGSMAAVNGHWKSREMEIRPLIEEGRKTVDMNKRIEIYQKVIDIVLEENPMVFLCWGLIIPTNYKYVKGFKQTGDYRMPWAEIWLDK